MKFTDKYILGRETLNASARKGSPSLILNKIANRYS